MEKQRREKDAPAALFDKRIEGVIETKPYR